jgi:hypothetical protein
MSERPSTFRVNIQVIQMIAVVFVALIVPLTLVILSFRQHSAPRSAVPEMQGLQSALEQAAEKSWQQPPPISDGRSVFLFTAHGSDEEARKAVEQCARKLNGVALPIAAAGPRGEDRLLVTIPRASSQLFESDALRNFTLSVQGSPTGERQLYEIVFPLP